METFPPELKDKPERFEKTSKTEVTTLDEAIEFTRGLPASKHKTRGILKQLWENLNSFGKREQRKCGKCLELGSKVFNY